MNYFIVEISTGLIVNITYIEDLGSYTPESGYAIYPQNGQNINDIYDPLYTRNHYVDGTTGLYLGYFPYNAFPSGAVVVPSEPADWQMTWDFVNEVYYWTKATLKVMATPYEVDKIVSGIVYEGINVPTSPDYLAILEAVVELAKTEAATETKYLFNSEVTNAEILELYTAVLKHIQTCYDASFTVGEAIDNGTITEPSEIETVFETAFGNLTTTPIVREQAPAVPAAIQAAIEAAIADLLDGAPTALDTLKELSVALNNNADFASTITAALANKVDKETGKGLSQENYTTTEKNKLNAITSGANVNTKAYEGTTLRNGCFPIFKSAAVGAVSSGNLVIYLTDDNTATGNALFPNGVILDSVIIRAQEGTQPHTPGTAALSNSNKTLTIPISKVATVLGLLSLNQNADGSVIKVTVWGY